MIYLVLDESYTVPIHNLSVSHDMDLINLSMEMRVGYLDAVRLHKIRFDIDCTHNIVDILSTSNKVNVIKDGLLCNIVGHEVGDITMSYDSYGYTPNSQYKIELTAKYIEYKDLSDDKVVNRNYKIDKILRNIEENKYK